MHSDEIELLWDRYLTGGSLSKDEREELLRALSADATIREAFLEDEGLHWALQGLGWASGDSTDFLEYVRHRVDLEGEATGFVKQVELRIEESDVEGREGTENGAPEREIAASLPSRRLTRRSLGRSGPSRGGLHWKASLVAAAVLVGLVMVVGMLASGRESEVEREARIRSQQDAREREEGLRVARDAMIRAEVDESRGRRLLVDIEREREQLLREPVSQDKPPATAEEERRKALADADGRKRQVEEEIREAVERARRLREELGRSEERVRKEDGSIPGPGTKPAEATSTQLAVAKVERVEGEVLLVTKGGRRPAKGGEDLLLGEDLETSGAASRASLVFADRTRVQVGAGTLLKEIKAEGAKRIRVESGTLKADVVKQPKEQPMLIATPHGEAKILGTTLRIIVDPDPKSGTRLEVEEGRVQLRNLAGKVVMVESGHFAVAAAGVELTTRPLPVDEIVLLPRQARLDGDDWRVVPDDGACSGSVLEAPAGRIYSDSLRAYKNRRMTSFAAFSFWADAGRDYHFWIRGMSTAAADPARHDCVGVELNGVQWVKHSRWAEADGVGLTFFDGFARQPGGGFTWVGGDRDAGRDGRELDAVPVTVRFVRGGRQALRLYAFESPIRIDAIWVTATQKSRPDPAFRVPTEK